MRLFHISDSKCQHITELMPAIKIIYQMEQEFAPYLTVEFIANGSDPNQKPGIILIVGDNVIRKYYTFKDKKDTIKLRKLLWKYLRKYYDIKDITDNQGYIKDFNKYGNAKVIQGWHNKKKHTNLNVNPTSCCKNIPLINEMSDFEKSMLHEEFRLDNRNLQNRNICKKNRHKHCKRNFAYNSNLYGRCIDENNWLCDKGYPKDGGLNYAENITLNAREKIRKDIIKKLKENNGKATKQLIDKIYLGGFFADRNNNCVYEGINKNEIINGKYNKIESFGKYKSESESEPKQDSKKNKNKRNNIICTILILYLLLFIFM